MIREIFPIRIYESCIDDSSYSKISNDLKQYITYNRSNFKTVKSWLGNTETDFPQTKFYSDDLKHEIYKHCYNFIEGLNPEIYELNIINLWVNINSKDSFQEDHHHIGPGSQFSGTLYIDTVDSGGQFEILNPNSHESYNSSNGKYKDRFKTIIKPEEKKIIIFPSYLVHRVTPNYTNKNRVSISFNIAKKSFQILNKWIGDSPENYGYTRK